MERKNTPKGEEKISFLYFFCFLDWYPYNKGRLTGEKHTDLLPVSVM